MSNSTARQPIPMLWISSSSILILLVVWWAVTTTKFISPTYLPSPQALVAVTYDLIMNGYQRVPLSEHIGYSLFRALAGFALGVAQIGRASCRERVCQYV